MQNLLSKFIIILGLLCGAFSHASTLNMNDLGYQALKKGDYKTALRYISFLAVNGDARAQYNLGVFYRDGIEVNKNYVEALRWFLKAADGGNMLGQYAAGMALYRGQGSSPDLHAARHYFLEATLQGHATAPLQIGRLYYTGEGLTQDHVLTYFWWKLADDRNAGGAAQNLARLAKIMNEDDIKKARDLIVGCSKITLRQCLPLLLSSADVTLL